MSRPHNCVHCTWMVCGDANWCSEKNEVMSDPQIIVNRNCPMWEWNPINALTLEEYDKYRPTKGRAVLDGQLKLEDA